MLQIAKADRKTRIVNEPLTDEELHIKTRIIANKSDKEKLADALVETLGFLVATRHGRKYKFGIDGAIENIQNVLDDVS